MDLHGLPGSPSTPSWVLLRHLSWWPACLIREAHIVTVHDASPTPTLFSLSPHPQVGGQVDLHGLPGTGNTPSWVRLARDATAGQVEILVDADVSAWPAGYSIALAPTGFDPSATESVKIAQGEGGRVGGGARAGCHLWMSVTSCFLC